MRSYDPAPAALPRALLVVPEIGEADTLAQRQAAWRGLVGPGLTVETVPGDHLSMLRGAGAVSVANVLTGWLGR
jgi:thioesterase domain-containing protein